MNNQSRVLPWVICGLAAIFYCYEYLLRVSPSVMSTDLMDTFGISATALGNLVGFYYYAYAPAQIPVGLLMDRYGPRLILTLATLACAVGTMLFGGSQLYWVAAIGRFLVGLGSAFAFVGVLKLATMWLPANRFAFISGMATTLGMIGAMSGQIILTQIVAKIDWQNTVLYSGLFGFLLAPVLWLIVRDAPLHHRVREEHVHHTLTVAVLTKEVKAILANFQMWVNGFIGFLLYLPTSVFAEFWGVPYLESAQGLTPHEAALAVSMIFLGWAVGGPIVGLVSDRIESRRAPLFMGALVACVLMVCLLTVPYLEKITIFSILFTFGVFSSAEVICFAIGRENCVPHLAGTAVAVTNFLIMMGGVVFQPLVGRLLDVFWTGEMLDGVRLYGVSSYQKALMILPVGLLLSFVMTFFLKETHCRPIADRVADGA